MPEVNVRNLTLALHARDNIVELSFKCNWKYVKIVSLRNHSINRLIDVVYKCIYIETENVRDKFIHLSSIQRNCHCISLGDFLTVEEFMENNSKIDFMYVDIRPFKYNYYTFGIKEIIDTIRNKFDNYLFYNNQELFFEINGCSLIIRVSVSNCGKIHEDTKINITASDKKIIILKQVTIDKKLFNKDYDFTADGIGGLNTELRFMFKNALSTRAISSDIIEKMNMRHCKGILLYGPPGCGKTLIARNIGKLISPLPPVIINGPELINKYHGQSEENIRQIFQPAIDDENTNGKFSNIHVIIFDEFDSLCSVRTSNENNYRNSITNQLLTMIDGVSTLNNIFIIAITNRIDLIDPAVLRSGRIDYHIHIGYPDYEGRLQIFNIHTSAMINNGMISKVIDYKLLLDKTEGFSGAEIEQVVKNAVTNAIGRAIDADNEEIFITSDDLINATDIIIEKNNIIKNKRDLLKCAFNATTDNIDQHIIIGNIISAVIDDTTTSILVIENESIENIDYNFIINLKNSIFDKKIDKDIIHIKLLNVCLLDDKQRAKILYDAFKENSIIILEDTEHIIDDNRLTYQTLYSILKYNREKNSKIICYVGNRYDHKKLSSSMFTTVLFK